MLDYLEYWGFQRPPFALTVDPENMYISRVHGECLMRLKFAILSDKGGALLVSENAGEGKTSVLRRLVMELEKELPHPPKVAFIDHPTLTSFQIIEEIGRQIGAGDLPSNKLRAINQIRKVLSRYNETGYRTIVIVDEGQMLAHRPDLLQELRILLNLCLPDRFLLSLIFSGQRPLERAVRSIPEFWQRLPVRYLLRNLDKIGTRELMSFRMKRAGLEEGKEIFTLEACEKIFRFSEGCPRVICSVADLALLIGCCQRVKTIGEQEVFEATRDMDSGSDGSYHYFHFIQNNSQLITPPPVAEAPLPRGEEELVQATTELAVKFTP